MLNFSRSFVGEDCIGGGGGCEDAEGAKDREALSD